MIVIDNIIVSDELISRHFVCNLNSCGGACCVEGESGAPLEFDELDVLSNVYPVVKKHLSPDGIKSIDEQGLWVKDKRGAYKTPLMKSGACAYARIENGSAKCGIQQACDEGEIDFPKPVSCHLYPVRVTRNRLLKDNVNYEEWNICNPACEFGSKLKMPLYRFVKDALIRKFGAEFYKVLEEIYAMKSLNHP